MIMAILLAVPIIIILFIASVVLLIRKKWTLALLLSTIAIVLNINTQQIPFNAFQTSHIEDDMEMITVFEYNVCARKDYMTKHDHHFIDYIVSQDADILFLPENVYYRDQELDSLLANKYQYGAFQYFSKKNRPYEMAIYSKFPLRNLRRLPCPGKPKGSHRMMTAVADINGTNVRILYLHAASNSIGLLNGYNKREIETQIIEKEAILEDPYVIVAGDMNDLSGSPMMRRFQKHGLKDAWWEKGSGFGFTYNQGLLHFRLDHILVSNNIDVMNVMTDSRPDYSDHIPLIARLRIKK